MRWYDDGPSISVEALADWLIDNGLAEDRRGYGHATGEQIAEKMLATFDIKLKGDT